MVVVFEEVQAQAWERLAQPVPALLVLVRLVLVQLVLARLVQKLKPARQSLNRLLQGAPLLGRLNQQRHQLKAEFQRLGQGFRYLPCRSKLLKEVRQQQLDRQLPLTIL